MCKIFTITLVGRHSRQNCHQDSRIPCYPESNLTFSGDANQKYNTRVLYFQNSNIQFVPGIIFKEFPNLLELRIWNMNETSIVNEMFQMIPELKSLNLGNYKFIIENSLENLKELEMLDLSENHFETIPTNVFRENRKLKKLNLYGNNLVEVDKDLLKSQTELEVIDLSNNPINVLARDFFKHNLKLKEIRLAGIGLSQVEPDLLENLVDLEKIDLSRNRLERLPNNFFITNINLREINIRGNVLSELDQNLLAHLKELRKFNAGSNNMTHIPKKIFWENKNLENVDLRYNWVEEWDNDIKRNFKSNVVFSKSSGILSVSWFILAANLILIKFVL